MNSEVLIPGMNFAKKHNLTRKEIEVLVPFLEKPYTTFELSKVLGAHKTTLHHVIQILKLKKLLILKDRDAKGTNLYEFNLKEVMEMGDEETKKEDTEKSEDSEEKSE